MDLQKQIQTLKAVLNSQRKVASHLGINRETVAKYWNGIIPESVNSLSPPKWSEQVDWEYFKKEIKNGVTIKTLYREFSQSLKLPAYANVARYFKTHFNSENELDVSLKIDRIPGNSLEVDYSGDKMQILNPSTGEILNAELFVAALSYSSFFYAEFAFSQKLSVFLESCSNAFKYIGGVTSFIISDNCKTAVTKAEKHDTYLNKSFNDFCLHFSVIADPARVRKPKDKPHVENAINVIQLEFFQKYRHTTFTSLFELNLVLKNYIFEKMKQKIPQRGLSRNELLEIERPHLRDLPSVEFEIFNYKKCKVHPDCHVRYLKNFYSVPYKYIGLELEIKSNSKMIYLNHDAEVVAFHPLSQGTWRYSTNKSHYPDSKLIDTNFHIQSALSKSNKIGPNTEKLVMILFDIPRNHPLRNLTKVMGVLSLADKFNNEALEYASGAAIEMSKFNFNYIKSCVKNYRKPKDQMTLLPNRQLEFVCLQGGIR